jgi:hypothetical protein
VRPLGALEDRTVLKCWLALAPTTGRCLGALRIVPHRDQAHFAKEVRGAYQILADLQLAVSVLRQAQHERQTSWYSQVSSRSP